MGFHLASSLSAKYILRRSNLFGNQAEAAISMDVPAKGYFAVYVGGGEGEKKRYVIPVSLLNQPSFQELLETAEEEYGFSYPMGGLIIPCTQDIFLKLAYGL